MNIGQSFTVSATIDDTENHVSVTLGEQDESGRSYKVPCLLLDGSPKPIVPTVRLVGGGGNPGVLSGEVSSPISPSLVQFITPESIQPHELGEIWDDILLSAAEDIVVKALQVLDRDVQRLAVKIGLVRKGDRRGGFIVKRRSDDRPVPIGSMGDGVWRMLGLAITMTQCQDGILLVDEIDAGLHYSVMVDMWKLIYETAKRLDVQVFATTHSYDCVRSLAKVITPESVGSDRITLQRIEVGRETPVQYTEEEIIVVADNDLEVR